MIFQLPCNCLLEGFSTYSCDKKCWWNSRKMTLVTPSLLKLWPSSPCFAAWIAWIDVSWNGGTHGYPQIIHFSRMDFPTKKTSILETDVFRLNPYHLLYAVMNLGLEHFLFSTIYPFPWTNIFQRGWNHHPVILMQGGMMNVLMICFHNGMFLGWHIACHRPETDSDEEIT